jgi:aryl-alcohol dehydrogenase-like predicted oxidoreductase
MGWRDDLLYLHTNGWNADDIDEACEAMHEACDEGQYEGTEVRNLTLPQVQSVLKVTLDGRLLRSLQAIAALRHLRNTDAEDLQRALYDLDAFAYEFAGDD